MLCGQVTEFALIYCTQNWYCAEPIQDQPQDQLEDQEQDQYKDQHKDQPP